MGELLPRYKKAIIEDLIDNISANNAYYYAFASNPISLTGGVPELTSDEFTTIFTSDWQMLFGKQITNNDILPVVTNIVWNTNTVYSKYDNRNANLYSSAYYVITPPATSGGSHDVYICLDNANNTPSTVRPDLIQSTSFQKSDGYIWRYITSISDSDMRKFSTTAYAPIYANNTIVTGAAALSGVDVVVVANGGSDYRTYANGYVQSNPTSNIIQVESTKSPISNFYVNCGIYIYTTDTSTAQLKTVTNYNVNSSGNWIHLDSDANTNNITPGVTQYIISPKVVFDTDGDTDPLGYAVVNTFSNSIYGVIITQTGTNISRANTYILPGLYGSGANIYSITPPPGGYGYDPASQLNLQGMSIAFNFSNTESSTIPTEIHYNKIGIVKNPSVLAANGTKSALSWSNTTFSQVLQANISTTGTFNVGDVVIGQTTNSTGVVAFSNSSTIYLTGDKNFANGEFIMNKAGVTSQLTINTLGDIYAKDLEPIYVQNLIDVQRSNSQVESYKLIIQV
jgi:hypothetical protein